MLVSEPALIEQMFTADPSVLYGEARIITPLVGKTSLLVLNEGEHRAMRALLRPPLDSEHAQRYHDVVVSLCEQEVASWPLNQPMALLPRLDAITLGVIMSVIFGVTEGARREAVACALAQPARLPGQATGVVQDAGGVHVWSPAPEGVLERARSRRRADLRRASARPAGSAAGRARRCPRVTRSRSEGTTEAR